LQRELAFRLAGLRGPRGGQPLNDPTRAPPAEPKPPGRNALHREPTARPGSPRTPTALPSAPSAPARATSHKPPAPAAAHPSRPPLASRQTETAGRIAVHREQPAAPRLTPTKAEALRTTTLAQTSTPDLAVRLAQRFGQPRPAPGWRIPHAMPAADPVANAVRSFLAEQQRPTPPATGRPCLAALVPGKPTI